MFYTSCLSIEICNISGLNDTWLVNVSFQRLPHGNHSRERSWKVFNIKARAGDINETQGNVLFSFIYYKYLYIISRPLRSWISAIYHLFSQVSAYSAISVPLRSQFTILALCITQGMYNCLVDLHPNSYKPLKIDPHIWYVTMLYWITGSVTSEHLLPLSRDC